MLQALLDKYADEGIAAIEEPQVLTIAPFSQLGTPVELLPAFGGKTQHQQAVHELEQAIYESTQE